MKSNGCYCKLICYDQVFIRVPTIINSKNTLIALEREISMVKIDAKIAMEELTMMLIYLSHFTERDRFANQDDKYAWKGYDFDVLNKLDEKDYIRQGSHRSKSMYITKEGESKAKELMEKYNVADW